MKAKNDRFNNVSKNIMIKVVKEKMYEKMRIKILRAQNVSAKKVWVKMWVRNMTLQNYESKKCCFQKSEREKGNS